MKILFVYPQYPDTFWSFKKALQFVSKKAAFPPLGLLTIAAMLPKEWDKKLIDTNIHSLEDKDIEWADMVFISAMIVQKDSTQKIISRCNQLDTTIVAGGPAFTTQHEKFKGVDHFVLNEAEITLPFFLKDLEEGTLQKVYSSPDRPDIALTPSPLWSLINVNEYATMSVQYSRGCPFNCEFCDIVIMNGRIPRTKASHQLLHELNTLYTTGWRGAVFIVDDNFIGNKIEAKKMLTELIEWQHQYKYPFRFFTEASTNLADDEILMELMSKANFYKVFLGIETPDVDGLKECGKAQNIVRDLATVIKKIQHKGMQVMGGFIVGFDSDKSSIFDAQIQFIQQTGVVQAMVGLLTALPKTQLWERLQREGRLLKDATGDNTDGTLNFIPKMKRSDLVEGYQKILSTIYSPKAYYSRIQTFIHSYTPTVRGGVSQEDVIAFFRSLWVIGVVSPARFEYWKLLTRTFFTNMKAFPVAVELAIVGHHFQTLAEV